MSFTETAEQMALRQAVAQLGGSYGYDYMVTKARAGGDMSELYAEAGKLGYLGINLPTEYGGGGGGMYELAIVEEEFGAAGCGLLMMVVSPAICGTVITKFGTDPQKDRWLPGLADGSEIMAFAITESDAGSNSHRITTTARRAGDDWILNGAKTYISGVDVANNVLVVANRGLDHRRPQAGALLSCHRRRRAGVHQDRDGHHQRRSAVQRVSR
jgi:hypothetical protein